MRALILLVPAALVASGAAYLIIGLFQAIAHAYDVIIQATAVLH